MYWIGFRVSDGTRAFVATAYKSHDEAMSAYEQKKGLLQLGDQVTPPLFADSEQEALDKMYATFGH